MYFELWSTVEGPEGVLGFLQPVTAAALSRLLADTAPPGQAAAAAAEAEVPLAFFWKARKVGPYSHDYGCKNSPEGKPGKANYYHFFSEWMPALSYTLCEQFGHCSFADRDKLTLIDVNKRFKCHERELHPTYYHEALACLSAHPFHHINGPTLRSRLTLVRTGWLGLGPRCRGMPPGCYKQGSGRLPPTPRLMGAWRSTVSKCMGVDPDVPAALEPLQLLVVDRLYDSGRHILNVNTIMRALRSRYSPQHVAVQLAYMEDLSLRQQAAYFGLASVVLHVHGAALANYVFLPKQAVTIQLGPLRNYYDPTTYTGLLAQDLANVSDIEVLEWQNSDPTRAHLNTEKVEASLWRKADTRAFLDNSELYGDFMATYTCPKSLPKAMRDACLALLHHLNLHLDLEVALNLTDAAITRAYRKQGRSLPPDLFAPANATAAGSSAVVGWGGSSDDPAQGSSGDGTAESSGDRPAEGSSSSNGGGSGGGRAEVSSDGPAAQGSSSSSSDSGSSGGGGTGTSTPVLDGTLSQEATAVLRQRLAASRAPAGLPSLLGRPGGTQLLVLGMSAGAAAAAAMLSVVRRRKK